MQFDGVRAYSAGTAHPREDLQSNHTTSNQLHGDSVRVGIVLSFAHQPLAAFYNSEVRSISMCAVCSNCYPLAGFSYSTVLILCRPLGVRIKPFFSPLLPILAADKTSSRCLLLTAVHGSV